jgi:glycerophosphoryl diester phosphodiesterase
MFSPDQFVAHRGYTAHYPENTLTAITAAIRAGATRVELDIQFSKDGIPMIYHDMELQRVSGKPGRIVDYTADELSLFHAYEPERLGMAFMGAPINRAEELVHLIKIKTGVHFYIELKEESLAFFSADYCLQSLRTLFDPVIGQCTLISDVLPAVKQAKQAFGFPTTGIVFRDWANRNVLIEEYLPDVAYINIERIPEHDRIEALCPIATYEIADPLLATATLQRGAAMIETYAIGELIGALCKSNTM